MADMVYKAEQVLELTSEVDPTQVSNTNSL